MIIRQLVNVAFVIGAAAIAQKYANMAAFVERGYKDLGGEMFVFPLMCFAGYYMTGVDAWIKTRRRKHKRHEAQIYELRRRCTVSSEHNFYEM